MRGRVSRRFLLSCATVAACAFPSWAADRCAGVAYIDAAQLDRSVHQTEVALQEARTAMNTAGPTESEVILQRKLLGEMEQQQCLAEACRCTDEGGGLRSGLVELGDQLRPHHQIRRSWWDGHLHVRNRWCALGWCGHRRSVVAARNAGGPGPARHSESARRPLGAPGSPVRTSVSRRTGSAVEGLAVP